jgi:hypothetical protein
MLHIGSWIMEPTVIWNSTKILKKAAEYWSWRWNGRIQWAQEPNVLIQQLPEYENSNKLVVKEWFNNDDSMK